MKDALLTEQEIIELTGAKQTSRQREILSKSGIFFIEKADHKISLTWGHVNNPGMRSTRQSFDESPNFASMN